MTSCINNDGLYLNDALCTNSYACVHVFIGVHICEINLLSTYRSFNALPILIRIFIYKQYTNANTFKCLHKVDLTKKLMKILKTRIKILGITTMESLHAYFIVALKLLDLSFLEH